MDLIKSSTSIKSVRCNNGCAYSYESKDENGQRQCVVEAAPRRCGRTPHLRAAASALRASRNVLKAHQDLRRKVTAVHSHWQTQREEAPSSRAARVAMGRTSRRMEMTQHLMCRARELCLLHYAKNRCARSLAKAVPRHTPPARPPPHPTAQV